MDWLRKSPQTKFILFIDMLTKLENQKNAVNKKYLDFSKEPKSLSWYPYK